MSQKITLGHTYNPIFWQKTSFLRYKNTLETFVGVFLSKFPLNSCAEQCSDVQREVGHDDTEYSEYSTDMKEGCFESSGHECTTETSEQCKDVQRKVCHDEPTEQCSTEYFGQ